MYMKQTILVLNTTLVNFESTQIKINIKKLRTWVINKIK